ncbi:MLP1-like protein [Saccharomyces kudriavzevii IFO 1802]|nr:MLP1-like protein [Saccharomyces kudriavzevii IFO 1802]
MKSTQNEEGASERLNVIASFFDCSLEQVKSIDTDIITRLNEKLIQFNELKSENLQITVSFDELKTNSLKKIDGLKTEMENVLRQNDEIRKERNDTSAKFEFLQNEKIQLSNELESVKRKLNDLTEEKKEIQSNQQRTLKILDERLKEVEMAKVENNRTNNECRNLRSTVVELETKQQTYITNDLNSRSELERKTQELNLLQSNKDWLEKELSSKSEQYLSYRQRTDATISEIRSELNRLKNDFQLEKTNNDVLKQKNNELSNSLQEKVLDLKNLSDSLNTEKQEFSTEIALKQRLIDLLETQLNAVKEELKSIRKSDSSNVTSDDSRKLISENESLLKDLRLTKEKLAQCESECLRLSSITEETGEESGTLTSRSSTDFILLKKQYIKEKRAKEQLQNQIESFIVELEHKVPVINSFKERTDMLENELNNSALLLEHTSNEKNAKIRELNIKNEKIAKCENDIHILTRQRLDLCRQVQYLLITNSVSNDSKGPLRKEEIKFIQNILQNDNSGTTESDSQKILTGRLVEFRNVIELQEKNTELLRITRNLADKLESNEIKSKQNLLKIENKTINEAKEAILSLQSEKMSLESKVEELERERETLKSSISKQASSFNNSVIQQLTKTKRELESQVQDLQARISQITRESTQNMSLLNKEIQDIYDSKSDISIELGKEKSSRI